MFPGKVEDRQEVQGLAGGIAHLQRELRSIRTQVGLLAYSEASQSLITLAVFHGVEYPRGPEDKRRLAPFSPGK